MNFSVSDSLGFIMNKTNTKLKNELLQQLKEDDITPEQWGVLTCLWDQDGITPKELADITYKDKPNTNRIIEKLQAKGFVIRTPHPVDKRAYQIFLTKSGLALREKLIPKVVVLLAKATRGIAASKEAEIKMLLNQIYNNLN